METGCAWRKYICYSNDDGDNNIENKTKICLFFKPKSLSVRQILKNNGQNFQKQYTKISSFTFPTTTIPSLVNYNLNTIPCALEHTKALMQTFC